MGMLFILLFCKFQKNFNETDDVIVTQRVYHAHYTANLIEDEIRQIRKEDYPLRKKYAELNNNNQ